MKNIYLRKFREKSDGDLQHIASNIDGYILEAREAAIQVLKERSEKASTPENVQYVVENSDLVTSRKIKSTPYKTKSFITDDPEAPELYSKNAITGFSIIFGTIYGSILLMQNMKALEKNNGRALVLIFGILYMIATIYAVNIFDGTSNIATVLNIIGAGILRAIWNHLIGYEFKFRKRDWSMAALISILISTALFLYYFFID